MQTITEKLIARKEGGIGRIIFNNPQRRNAVSLEMLQALTAVLEDFGRDPAVRVVLLSGAGDKSFVSGADMSEFKEQLSTLDGIAHFAAVTHRATQTLAECPKPTIAMIRGYCIGAGLSIAIACDLRMASDNSRFGVPGARLGVGHRCDTLKRLTELVGPAYTTEIFYSVRQFDAHEAWQIGLVNKVVAVAEFEKHVLDYAAALAIHAPLTVAAVKHTMIDMSKDPAEQDMASCQKMMDACFASQDYIEGRTAFSEKRKPVFLGC